MLVGGFREVGAFARVFHGEAGDVPVAIEIQLRVLIQVPRLDDGDGFELDVERFGVREVLNPNSEVAPDERVEGCAGARASRPQWQLALGTRENFTLTPLA